MLSVGQGVFEELLGVQELPTLAQELFEIALSLTGLALGLSDFVAETGGEFVALLKLKFESFILLARLGKLGFGLGESLIEFQTFLAHFFQKFREILKFDLDSLGIGSGTLGVLLSVFERLTQILDSALQGSHQSALVSGCCGGGFELLLQLLELRGQEFDRFDVLAFVSLKRFDHARLMLALRKTLTVG